MSNIISLLQAILIVALTFAYMDLRAQVRKNAKIACDYTDTVRTILADRIDLLEKGISPDYDKAQEAAKALNAFNDNIYNILNYDPYRAITKKDGDND